MESVLLDRLAQIAAVNGGFLELRIGTDGWRLLVGNSEATGDAVDGGDLLEQIALALDDLERDVN